MKELTYSELKRLEPDSYILIDTRDSGNVLYGMIPGAIHIAEDEVYADLARFAKEFAPTKAVILYCQRGVQSVLLAEAFAEQGRECFSLSGEYLAYLRGTLSSGKTASEIQAKAEESIHRKFHKQLLTPFAKACKQYKLIQEGDHIAVCIFGGKDSMLWLNCFRKFKNTTW